LLDLLAGLDWASNKANKVVACRAARAQIPGNEETSMERSEVVAISAGRASIGRIDNLKKPLKKRLVLPTLDESTSL